MTKTDVPVIPAWRTFALDPDYGGHWVVTGDLTGDGRAEIVSARNHCDQDRHWVVSVVVHTLDGEVVWRWGEPGAGRREIHHDVAVQIYDWDGDGHNEVLLASRTHLVVLEGATGREKRKLPLPDCYSSDCLVIANLTGGARADDIIIKDRYWNIWAYDVDWKQLWHVCEPGGYRTAHQPIPLDLDGDGHDEVMAGYAMLNCDGTKRWVLDQIQSKVELARTHLDCFRVVRHGGKDLNRWRLAMTYCGGGMGIVDGNGQILKELVGSHYESVDVGRMDPDGDTLGLLVDITVTGPNQPIVLLSEELELLGEIIVNANRHHTMVDWEGHGAACPVIASTGMIYNGKLEPINQLELPAPGEIIPTNRPSLDGGGRKLGGDMDGDGRVDITIVTNDFQVCIFRNDHGNPVDEPVGCGVNFTFY